MYSFVTFFISYPLLCPQFILYSFLYHSVLVVVGDRWHVQLRDILHQLPATVPPVHIVSFPLSFCIGCSRRSLTCTASWHSSSVTRYCASSSYCIISFIILYWLQSEITDMYIFMIFDISYSLLCLQFILYHFLYHYVLVAVGNHWHVQLRYIRHQLLATVAPVHIGLHPGLPGGRSGW